MCHYREHDGLWCRCYTRFCECGSLAEYELSLDGGEGANPRYRYSCGKHVGMLTVWHRTISRPIPSLSPGDSGLAAGEPVAAGTDGRQGSVSVSGGARHQMLPMVQPLRQATVMKGDG